MFITFGIDARDSAQSLDAFIENGAEEFFAGFVPKEWLEKYGWEVCPNRRPLGGGFNYTQTVELDNMVKAIHARGKRINLAVNAHDNGSERMAMIRRTVEIMDEFDPDGYIVADPAVMASMAKWGIDKPMHISTGAGCFNSDAVRFFCEHFNVRRIVIPRKMTLNEMRRMLEKCSDLKVEFEVMIIGYRCYFNDEDCHSIHSGARKNLCAEFQDAQLVASNLFPDNWKDAAEDIITCGNDCLKPDSKLNQFCQEWQKNAPKAPDYRPRYSCSGVNTKVMTSMVQNCGLCAIKELRDMGVHALKVPLRGGGNFKVTPLKLVHDVMTYPDPTPEFCKKLLNSPAFCDQLTYCYYNVPEAHLNLAETEK